MRRFMGVRVTGGNEEVAKPLNTKAQDRSIGDTSQLHLQAAAWSCLLCLALTAPYSYVAPHQNLRVKDV